MPTKYDGEFKICVRNYGTCADARSDQRNSPTLYKTKMSAIRAVRKLLDDGKCPVGIRERRSSLYPENPPYMDLDIPYHKVKSFLLRCGVDVNENNFFDGCFIERINEELRTDGTEIFKSFQIKEYDIARNVYYICFYPGGKEKSQQFIPDE